MSGSTNTFFVCDEQHRPGDGRPDGDQDGNHCRCPSRSLIGYAVAIAVAQDTSPGTPHTSVTTDGLVSGGYITSSHTGHVSVDFPYGRTPSWWMSR